MLATRPRLHCAVHTSRPHSLSSPHAPERVGPQKTLQNNQKSKTPLNICGDLSLEESEEGVWGSRSVGLTGPNDKGRKGKE